MSSALADAKATPEGQAPADAQDQNTAEDSTLDAKSGTPEAGQDQPKAGTLLTKPDVTPEPVTPAVTAPEGYDPAVTERVMTLAKELGMTDAAHAQKVVDALAGEAKMAVESFKTSVTKGGAVWTETVNRLEAQALADKEIGGSPENLARSLTQAKRVLSQYATPELSAFLAQSGDGSHPEVIRFLVRVAKAMGEDALVQGEPPAGVKKSRAGRVYPNLPDEGI